MPNIQDLRNLAEQIYPPFKADQWLHESNIFLNGRSPLAVAKQSSQGYWAVVDLLRNLKTGTPQTQKPEKENPTQLF